MTRADVRPTLWPDSISHRVHGRVTLDGEPVTYFGVTTTHNPLFAASDYPTTVRSRDGSFSVDLPSGTWSLIIAGPGFARYVVPNIVARDGFTHPPLSVEVSRGHDLEGSVVVSSGAPVPRARVRLMNSERPDTGDLLWELARGNQSAVTDVRGHFQISHVATGITGASSPRIAAYAAAGTSLTQTVSGAGTSISLPILPLGAINGTVVGGARKPGTLGDFFVVTRSVTNPESGLTANVTTDGSFRFDGVPEGEHDIGTFTTSGRLRLLLTGRIIVIAGQTTTVSLSAPE